MIKPLEFHISEFPDRTWSIILHPAYTTKLQEKIRGGEQSYFGRKKILETVHHADIFRGEDVILVQTASLNIDVLSATSMAMELTSAGKGLMMVILEAHQMAEMPGNKENQIDTTITKMIGVTMTKGMKRTRIKSSPTT